MHLSLGIGGVFGSGADAGLNMLLPGYDEDEIFFLFFEWESAPLCGEPRDNNGSLRRRAFPLFQYLEFHPMSAGPGQADPIQ